MRGLARARFAVGVRGAEREAQVKVHEEALAGAAAREVEVEWEARKATKVAAVAAKKAKPQR